MKELITQLQNEVNLDKKQARTAVGIFRNYLIKKIDDTTLTEALKGRKINTSTRF
ncbi:MAG: hypothetical protein LBQ60_00520 [Bacteroidales bacterium]|jgi:recombinational DNA repair protein RecR|nr:hypothetical protein [Bacteroidales bacterium]